VLSSVFIVGLGRMMRAILNLASKLWVSMGIVLCIMLLCVLLKLLRIFGFQPGFVKGR